jgi:hypothetical protein
MTITTMPTHNSMLTLVAAQCAHCGSTADTVAQDRYLFSKPNSACCEPAPSERVCWYCATIAPDPFWLGGRPFCCHACASDWAE